MPGALGRVAPFLQVYLHGLTPQDDVSGIRRSFLEAAPLEEQGQHTLDLALTPENVPVAESVKSALFRVADELRRNGQDQGLP